VALEAHLPLRLALQQPLAVGLWADRLSGPELARLAPAGLPTARVIPVAAVAVSRGKVLPLELGVRSACWVSRSFGGCAAGGHCSSPSHNGNSTISVWVVTSRTRRAGPRDARAFPCRHGKFGLLRNEPELIARKPRALRVALGCLTPAERARKRFHGTGTMKPVRNSVSARPTYLTRPFALDIAHKATRPRRS
jgi:hypothetical protein